MKLNMSTQGGIGDEFGSTGGGNVLNALILSHDPQVPLEAATKQYVDNSYANLNASNLISGTLSTLRLPAMSGDLSSTSGSGVFSLSDTGVTPGSYPKVTVDAKGRVTNGALLLNSDIPNLDWGKISVGKPTTVSGYGITDAISVSGGTLTDYLSISSTVSASTQLANKAYITTVSGSVSGVSVGDVVANVDPTTPVGFFRCNGSELDKTTYASLYAIIGDRYTSNSEVGSGQPWRQQYQINDMFTPDIQYWTTSSNTLPGILSVSQAIVTKNRVYMCGGYNGSAHSSTVYRADINADGTLGTWANEPSLPGVLTWSCSVVTKNRVYLIGGWNGSAAVTTVYTAAINSDGTLGTWGNGPSLPSIVQEEQAIVTKSRVYVIGGTSTTAPLSSVYYAPINTDGTLGTWVTDTSLPIAMGISQAIVTKNRVYMCGGHTGAGFTYMGAVYTAPINADGSLGAWVVSTPLPEPIARSMSIVTKNRAYIFGGSNGSTVSSKVYSAAISEDGTLGTWMQGTSLPGALSISQAIVTKNRIHLFNGSNGSAHVNVVYTAPFNGGLNDYSAFYAAEATNYLVAGSGRPWQQQYQINTTQTTDITGWITDSSSLPGPVTAAQAVVTKDRVYILGGYNGSAAIATTYTASINTDGTLGTWTTGTNLPNAIYNSTVFVTNSCVYLIGGYNNSNATISNIYAAPINTDGTLGAWIDIGNLPVGLVIANSIVTKNRVYVIGGYNGSSYLSTVYTATINADGTLGTWTTGTSMPGALANSKVILTHNRIYLLGGYNGSSYVGTVYSAGINSNGTLTTWSTETSIPGNMSHTQAIVTKGRAYLLGGYNGGSVSTVYTAPINTDGTLGTWVAGTSLPGPVREAAYFVAKNKIYVAGGWSTGTLSSIYSATITDGLNDYSPYYDGTAVDFDTNNMTPGSGKPWSQQYQINTTFSGAITNWTAQSLPGTLGQSNAVVTKNRVYLLGGTTGGAAMVSTVYTAPINGDGTVGTWTTGTSLPIAVGSSAVIVTANRVHLMGGQINTNSTTTNTYSAPINSDGTIGTWVQGVALPAAIQDTFPVITKNRVYLLGNNSNGNVWTAPISPDGSIGVWAAGTALPVTPQYSQWIVTKNRIYMCGRSGSSEIYSCYVNSDGILGGWSLSGNMPSATNAGVSFVFKDKAYVCSCWGSNSVFSAPINANGTLGTFTESASQFNYISWGTVFLTSTKVYVCGGHDGNVYTGGIRRGDLTGSLDDYSSYYTPDTNNYLMPGSGKPWAQQYQINETQTNDIIGWSTGTTLPVGLAASQAIVTKNRVYLIGGTTGSYTSDLYTAPINTDGTIGTWTTDSNSLPAAVAYAQPVFTKNRVYILGGYNGVSALNTVYTAAINSDGTLGAWSASASLPGVLSHSQVVVTKTRMYLLGGWIGTSNTYVATIYYAPINDNGLIGNWVTDSNSLPEAFGLSHLVVTKNRVYLCGGYNPATGSYRSEVRTAPINADGTLGTWTNGTALPAARGTGQVFVTKTRAYIMGGNNNSIKLSSVINAPINADGTLGVWSSGTSLPIDLSHSSCVITKNYIYLLGGDNGPAISTTYKASILEGLNDYLPYYDGTILPLGYIPDTSNIVPVSTTFKIPDHSLTDTSLNYFIKY